jgi:hypothetical protein
VPPHSGLLNPKLKTTPDYESDGIGVYLVRQVHVEVAGRSRYRSMMIGSSQLIPVPPSMSEVYSSPHDVCLDWQGEAKCWEDVTCGSFTSGALSVKVRVDAEDNVRSNQVLTNFPSARTSSL